MHTHTHTRTLNNVLFTCFSRLKGTDASWLDDEEPPREVRPARLYALVVQLIPVDVRKWSTLMTRLNVLLRLLAKLLDGMLNGIRVLASIDCSPAFPLS
jgi:hypothetical protein